MKSIRGIIIAAIALFGAVTAQADSGTVYDVTTSLSCGTSYTGTCTIANDGVDKITFHWTSAGVLQVVDYTVVSTDANGYQTLAVKDVYNGNNGSNPRSYDVVNQILTDALGNGVLVNLQLTPHSRLNRSGHNYYVYSTTVDGGSISIL